MSGINSGRVLAGGLLAGLIFNVGETILNAVILASSMAEIAQAHQLQDPGGAGIGIFVLAGFLIGILMIWLYAAVRPRLGPGPKTAAKIGAVIWFVGYLVPTLGWVIFGLLPVNLAVLASGWGLVETVLAAVAGAWLYQEA